MTAVFADTSFWIALTNEADAAYQKAQALSSSMGRRKIITSESVLTEYLNYFAGWGPHLRKEASANVEALLFNRLVMAVFRDVVAASSPAGRLFSSGAGGFSEIERFQALGSGRAEVLHISKLSSPLAPCPRDQRGQL